MKTNLIMGDDNPSAFLHEGAITAEECAEAVIRAFEKVTFLILPHAEVAQYIVKKAENRDRWLHSLRKIRAGIVGSMKN